MSVNNISLTLRLIFQIWSFKGETVVDVESAEVKWREDMVTTDVEKTVYSQKVIFLTCVSDVRLRRKLYCVCCYPILLTWNFRHSYSLHVTRFFWLLDTGTTMLSSDYSNNSVLNFEEKKILHPLSFCVFNMVCPFWDKRLVYMCLCTKILPLFLFCCVAWCRSHTSGETEILGLLLSGSLGLQYIQDITLGLTFWSCAMKIWI